MKTVIEMAMSPLKAEREIAVARAIANADLLSRDPGWDKERAYEIAKEVITDCNLPADEYERAMKQLKEVLKV